ncbi:MAG: hypothetical protein JKY56_04210 [Kofleriaceae bacterium]|nr:hypothetical protein [Kofleriaceae bacterium]
MGISLFTACSSMDEPVGFDDDRSDQVIDYFLPEVPTDIVLGEEIEASIAYGRCVTEGSTDVIEINCGTPWSEVGWFKISAEEIAGVRELGDSVLVLNIGVAPQEAVTDRLRVSVHEVNAEGLTHKLASEELVLDGETIRVLLENDLDHYIYVARGGTPLTSTRTAEFTLMVSTATE